MKPNLLSLSTLCVLLAGLALPTLRADLNSDLAFTAFHDVDLNALASGTVLQARGPIMAFPRGITSQSLLVIDAAPADVAKRLATWNPARHSDLKVWLHHPLTLQPKAEELAAAMASLPDNSSMDFQFKTTASLNPASPALQVSKEEAQMIASAAGPEKDGKALFAKVWPQIIVARVNAFLSGNGAASSDAGVGGDVHPLSEVKSLLHADPKVYGQYQKLLNQTPVKTLSGNNSAKISPADVYCDAFDVQGSAALGCGAIYQGPAGNAIQSFDVEFYCNYGVYTTIELEQMWPVTINGKTETLVWREDLVSAPNVAYLHGTERLASSMIMLQETKGGVQAFRDEFK